MTAPDPRPFRPYPLLRGPHLQTVLPAVLRAAPKIAWRMQRLETPDGDFIDIGHHGPAGGPLALLLHGLGGDLQSGYLRGSARRLAAAGWHCIGVQQRGAGPQPNLLPRSYNHGASDDIRWLLEEVARHYPKRPMTAVGWSLGGNVLLKALGESGSDTPLHAAVAVSVPFALAPCVERMGYGSGRLYRAWLLRGLKAAVRRKHGPVPLPDGADLAAALAARDFRDFDNAYTAPCNGYRDADDYYSTAACGRYLTGIRIPTRIVHALDDPMMVPDIVPAAGSLPPGVTLDVVPHGGHVGFVSAQRGGLPGMWLEHRLPEWLGGLCAPDTATSGREATA